MPNIGYNQLGLKCLFESNDINQRSVLKRKFRARNPQLLIATTVIGQHKGRHNNKEFKKKITGEDFPTIKTEKLLLSQVAESDLENIYRGKSFEIRDGKIISLDLYANLKNK